MTLSISTGFTGLKDVTLWAATLQQFPEISSSLLPKVVLNSQNPLLKFASKSLLPAAVVLSVADGAAALYRLTNDSRRPTNDEFVDLCKVIETGFIMGGVVAIAIGESTVMSSCLLGATVLSVIEIALNCLPDSHSAKSSLVAPEKTSPIITNVSTNSDNEPVEDDTGGGDDNDLNNGENLLEQLALMKGLSDFLVKNGCPKWDESHQEIIGVDEDCQRQEFVAAQEYAMDLQLLAENQDEQVVYPEVFEEISGFMDDHPDLAFGDITFGLMWQEDQEKVNDALILGCEMGFAFEVPDEGCEGANSDFHRGAGYIWLAHYLWAADGEEVLENALEKAAE